MVLRGLTIAQKPMKDHMEAVGHKETFEFADQIAYYNAYDKFHGKHNPDAMEKLLAGYVNVKLDRYLAMLEE